MNVISESEPVLVIRSKAVRNLQIIQTAESRYRITVNLVNQEEALELVTFRKTRREWASLDRLAKHMREKYAGIPGITLTLYSGEATK